MTTENNQALPADKIDYMRLPFEVYYSGPLTVTSYAFRSDVEVKRFKDVKAVHMEQGRSWGVTLYCQNNQGPELYCCITAGHDELKPEWLNFLDEEDLRFSSGANYAVSVKNNEISFVEDDEIPGIDDMITCCSSDFMGYSLGEILPDYIILDADGSRVKVNTDGFVLDENGEIGTQRIFNPEELDEDEYEDYSRLDLWEAKFDWVKDILKSDFRKDTKLKLSFNTE
jgi:hypothetical protein